MKFFLISITFAIALDLAWAVPMGQQVNITRNMCFQAANISAENVRRIQHNDYPDNQETYRYMRCFFENLELWNEKDGIQDERIGEILEGQRDRTNILNIVRKCNDNSRTNNTDVWLYNTVDCIANGRIAKNLENIFTAS